MKMELKKIIKEYNLKFYYILMMVVFTIDYTTTFIALNLRSGFQEVNPIAAFLFSLGWYGWVFHYLFAIFAIGTFLFFATSLILRLKSKRKLILIIPIITFIFLEILTITNNIILLIK